MKRILSVVVAVLVLIVSAHTALAKEKATIREIVSIEYPDGSRKIIDGDHIIIIRECEQAPCDVDKMDDNDGKKSTLLMLFLESYAKHQKNNDPIGCMEDLRSAK